MRPPPSTVIALLALALDACAPPQPPRETVAVPREIAAVRADVPDTFPSEADPPIATASAAPIFPSCTPPPQKQPVDSGRRVFEFAPIDVPAVPFGPRIIDMPHRGRARSVATMAQQIAAHLPALHECFRWARFKSPSLQGPMSVHFEVTPFGSIESLHIDEAKHWGELGSCVDDVLRSGMQASSFTPRRTAVSAVLDLEPSGQNAPPTRPDRPKTTRAPTRSGCVPANMPLPVDAVTFQTSFRIDDFDDDQAEVERQRAECHSHAGARCHIALPTDRHGGMRMTTRVSSERDGYILRKYIGYNRGAFSACWLEARGRRPDVGGQVSLVATLPSDGRTTGASVEASTSGDSILDACLQHALSDIWFPGAPDASVTVVHIPFRLSPDRPSAAVVPSRDTASGIASGALSALTAGDGMTALRRYAALAGHAPACEVDLGILRALVLDHPWIDETVMTAADKLSTDTATGHCLEEASLELARLAALPHRMGAALQNPELLETAAERYELALRLRENPLTQDLRTNLADVFRKLGREEDVRAWLPPGATPTMPPAD